MTVLIYSPFMSSFVLACMNIIKATNRNSDHSSNDMVSCQHPKKNETRVHANWINGIEWA